MNVLKYLHEDRYIVLCENHESTVGRLYKLMFRSQAAELQCELCCKDCRLYHDISTALLCEDLVDNREIIISEVRDRD